MCSLELQQQEALHSKRKVTTKERFCKKSFWGKGMGERKGRKNPRLMFFHWALCPNLPGFLLVLTDPNTSTISTYSPNLGVRETKNIQLTGSSYGFN